MVQGHSQEGSVFTSHKLRQHNWGTIFRRGLIANQFASFLTSCSEIFALMKKQTYLDGNAPTTAWNVLWLTRKDTKTLYPLFFYQFYGNKTPSQGGASIILYFIVFIHIINKPFLVQCQTEIFSSIVYVSHWLQLCSYLLDFVRLHFSFKSGVTLTFAAFHHAAFVTTSTAFTCNSIPLHNLGYILATLHMYM